MIAQRSPAWFAQRCGAVTASMMTAVLAKGKEKKEALTRENYRWKIVAERLTGKVEESFSSAATNWGIEKESFAKQAYEAHAGVLVDDVGFCTHPTIKWLGASPDGLLMGNGLLEAKCPFKTEIHLGYRLQNQCPPRYVAQVQCQLWVTERDWTDFVSYDPRLPERLQLFVCRVQRDEKFIAEMEAETIKFLSEVEETINKQEELVSCPF